jgi:hypothetical protein
MITSELHVLDECAKALPPGKDGASMSSPVNFPFLVI